MRCDFSGLYSSPLKAWAVKPVSPDPWTLSKGFLVLLAPAVDRADVTDRRAVDTRVEIAAENLREIGGVLRALVHHHADLLAARLVALVVEVHVQYA